MGEFCEFYQLVQYIWAIPVTWRTSFACGLGVNIIFEEYCPPETGFDEFTPIEHPCPVGQPNLTLVQDSTETTV